MWREVAAPSIAGVVALEIVDGVRSDATLPAMAIRAAERGTAVLAVWSDAQPGLILGRFHLDRPEMSCRRLTGGRTVAGGPDHIRVALALPHRSALESADPGALRPEQTMNRCVRGLLDACRALGADVVYPGRDVVTVDRVPVGWLSLTEAAPVGCLFEAGLGVRRGILDGAAGGPTRHDVTGPTAPVSAALASVARQGGSPADVARAVVESYVARPWKGVGSLPAEGLPVADPIDRAWSAPSAADRVGTVPAMLGAVSAYVDIDAARRLRGVRLCGDMIAPLETVRALERAVVGTVALRSEVERVIAATLTGADRWILGVDAPRDLAGAIMEAVA